MVVLALDYGEKRIGIAVTDETGRFVKPLDFIPNNSEIKKFTAQDFPKGTTVEEIQKKKKENLAESRIELKKVCNKLLHLINCYYPEKLVVGLPTVVDEKTNLMIEGQQAKKVKKFVKNLNTCLHQNKVILPVEFIEESMSSKMAEDSLRKQGITTTDKIRERIDSESAKLLLEEYIYSNIR